MVYAYRFVDFAYQQKVKARSRFIENVLIEEVQYIPLGKSLDRGTQVSFYLVGVVVQVGTGVRAAEYNAALIVEEEPERAGKVLRLIHEARYFDDRKGQLFV